MNEVLFVFVLLGSKKVKQKQTIWWCVIIWYKWKENCGKNIHGAIRSDWYTSNAVVGS